jgi:tetratricopeptide (TPR) repeat protein
MTPSLKNFRSVTLLLLLASTAAVAQFPGTEVRKRLDFIYSGQAERVRIELPNLEKQYPNDAGVAYLDAILTTDGEAAVKKFQAIVDLFPQSEWADAALYKVYQYYYSIGLYKTADQKFAQLKQQYPNSLYVTGTVKEQTPAPVQQQQPVPEVKQPDTAAQKPAETPAVVPQPAAQQAAPPAQDSTVAAPAAPASHTFAVQAGAYSTRRKAKKQVEFLSSISRTGVITKKISGDKKLYVVTVEGFATEQEARDFIAELKLKYGMDSIIVAR